MSVCVKCAPSKVSRQTEATFAMTDYPFNSFFSSKEAADAARQTLDSKDNKVIIITGPAGAGKSTLCQQLEKEQPGRFVILHDEGGDLIPRIQTEQGAGKKVLLVTNSFLDLQGIEADVVLVGTDGTVPITLS
jgi:ABC-type cobalamin/Fe3+-siderophores transport system ATPase subunit